MRVILHLSKQSNGGFSYKQNCCVLSLKLRFRCEIKAVKKVNAQGKEIKAVVLVLKVDTQFSEHGITKIAPVHGDLQGQ